MELGREKLMLEKQKAESEQENVHNFKSRELDMQEKQLKFSFGNLPSFIPTFSEDDVGGFFKSFEKIAERNEWPKEDRMLLVAPKLIGKALKVYNGLDNPDYDYVKKQILYAYAFTPDGYRQRFRSLIKSSDQTCVEIANGKIKDF